MRPRFLVTAATALIFTFLSSPAPVRAASNLLFILDSSGSMWGKLEGKAKMETAKAALSKLVGDLPKDTQVGLMAYGHRVGRKEPGACSDIELLLPVGKATPDDVVSWLGRINPKGKTPIAGSLRQTPGAFAGLEKSNNNIVLISDGIETCDGDPCAVAGELARSNINVRVHVVGFDISNEDRAQLECIAKLGKGKYFAANSTEGFTKAVTEAVKVAQVETKPAPAPPPPPLAPPPPPKPVVYFEDNFDGEVLGEHWEVLKPNPDAFVVEDGKLLIVSGTSGSLAKETVENVFRLSKSLPKGDWTMTARLKIDFQTSNEVFFLGLHHDNDNHIMGSTWAPVLFGQPAALHISGTKRSKGNDKKFEKDVWNDGTQHDGKLTYSETMSLIPQPILIRLRKKGRSFFVGAKLEGLEDAKWIEADKLTSLRAKGTLAFGISQTKKTKGESTATIDWVKIETLKAAGN